MTTARAWKIAERLVKLYDLGNATQEAIAEVIEGAAGLQELEDSYASMVQQVLELTEARELQLSALNALLEDGSNGSARKLAELAIGAQRAVGAE